MAINPLDFGDMFSKSSRDFKKMAQELKDYNKSMRASNLEANQAQSSRNNSISNPLADARSGIDQFSKQAAAIGKMQKIQTSAITGVAGYTLKEQRKRDRRNVKNLEKINRNTEVQRGFGEMISNSFTNFFGLMPNRAARKRAATADVTQIKEAAFSKIRTVSLVSMMEMMKADKALAKARIDSDIKHEIRQKSDREKIYKEQRKQGKTASEAWKIAKDGTKESKEERTERTKREDRTNAGLLEAIDKPFTMDDRTLQALADGKKEGAFARMFKWLKTGAMLAGLGALIGDFIGDWLGDQTDKVFGKNSWLGNIFRDNGWLGGAIAGLALPLAATGAIATAVGALGTLLTGKAGLLGLAGLAGWTAGTWLSDNLVQPWLDDFYERKNAELLAGENFASKTGTKQATTAGGEKLYRMPFAGGEKVVPESEITKRGIKPEQFESMGITPVMGSKILSTGVSTSPFGDHMSEEALAKASAFERGTSELQHQAGHQGPDSSAQNSMVMTRALREFMRYEKGIRAFLGNTYKTEEDAMKGAAGLRGLYRNSWNSWQGFKKLVSKEDFNKVKNAFKSLHEWSRREIYSGWSVDYDKSSGKLFLDSLFDNIFLDEYNEHYGLPGDEWREAGGGKGMFGKGWNIFVQDRISDIGLKRGGLVTGPIRALIGEAGPEAVLPLDKVVGVISDALSKAMDSPSMKALASRQRLEAASSASGGRRVGGGGVSNTTVVTNQNNSSFVNLTPSATTNNGPSWIRTISD